MTPKSDRAEAAEAAKAAEPAPVDGSFFLHATAGSRTMLTADEYAALVDALAKMRDHKKAPKKH